MNATFTVPAGMPETVTLVLTPTELLALGAVLDHADPEFLRGDGVREEVIEVSGHIYDTVEGATSIIYGDDWDLLTSVEAAGEQFDEDMIFPLDAYEAGRF
jgi:hypothetical protein